MKSWKNLRVECFLIASEGIYRFILTLLEFLLPPVIANEFVKLRGLTLNIPTLSIIITELESFLLVGWTSNTVQVTRWVFLTWSCLTLDSGILFINILICTLPKRRLEFESWTSYHSLASVLISEVFSISWQWFLQNALLPFCRFIANLGGLARYF